MRLRAGFLPLAACLLLVVPAGCGGHAAPKSSPNHQAAARIVREPRLGLSVTIPAGLTRDALRFKRPEIVIVKKAKGANAIPTTAANLGGMEMVPPSTTRFAEARATTDLLTGFGPHGPVVRSRVTVAGVPAVEITGLSWLTGSGSTPRTSSRDIIFVRPVPARSPVKHNRQVYLLVLPGKRPSTGQRAILASIKFIPRRGVFECGLPGFAHVSIWPSPVALGRKLSVALSCGRPRTRYRFVAERSPPGTRSISLGVHRAGKVGMVRFHWRGFSAPGDAGKWQVNAYVVDARSHATGRLLRVRKTSHRSH